MATRPDQKPSIAPIVGPDDERRFTDSGIEIKHRYDAEDVEPSLDERLGEPGEYPFTRGIHPDMYRGRKWTMRQYAGYATAAETNERFRYLIEHGSTGLSMAFDLPTQLGRDSDDPLCAGEVGRTGVAIDTIDDMRRVFDGIPLDQVSTSMTINAPAAVLLLLYELVGEEQNVAADQLRGTTQNDVLKEYIARGNFIYPPGPAMRLTTDLFAYCRERVPRWNTISISGYHMREKGCSAVQEVGFTLANAIAYVQAAIDAGLQVDEFGPRLAFFFNGHNNVFQEVAKFRAARRMWARIMRERFGAKDERSLKMRFHTQTGGVTLAAQQPHNNIVRVALQGFAAVCGGTQSLHTNGFDEALALPSETAARIALRTQQILAHEAGAADTADPFAGSYFVEALTDEIEAAAQELIDRVEEMGGSVNCIPFIRAEVEESAWGYEERYRQKQDIVVGVNEYVTEQVDEVEILRVDPESERQQVERLAKFKEERDQAAVDSRLEELRRACAGDANLLEPMRAALKERASIGEVCGVSSSRSARIVATRSVPKRSVQSRSMSAKISSAVRCASAPSSVSLMSFARPSWGSGARST
jgi:methylmalonyl-CoA mutase N-terminal domain/subunit